MGRVGDGGGLRLEKRKRQVKNQVEQQSCAQDTDKEPSCTCTCNSGQQEWLQSVMISRWSFLSHPAILISNVNLIVFIMQIFIKTKVSLPMLI